MFLVGGLLGAHGTSDAWAVEAKIGVLREHSDHNVYDIREVLEVAKNNLNADYAPINSSVTLKVIDVAYDADVNTVAAEVRAAVSEGFTHFIVPTPSATLLTVKEVIENVSPGSIMISPGSESTMLPALVQDDNLFRLAVNHDVLARQFANQFDQHGLDKIVIVTQVHLCGDAAPDLRIPDDAHDHFEDPPTQFPICDPRGHGASEANARSAIELDRKVAALKDQYGDDRVGVLVISTPYAYAGFVRTLLDQQLTSPGSVTWITYPPYRQATGIITADPAVAEFTARVNMNIHQYTIAPNEFNRPLINMQSAIGFSVNHTYAAHDALYLLADGIVAAGGAELVDKDFLFEVSDGEHSIEGVPRVLGQGALGDYVLDRSTGDLLEGPGFYVDYTFRQTDGGYAWAQTTPHQAGCR